jgi:hypothetical protein
MINWLKVASIALVALAYAEQSHACRFNKPFDPEKLKADVVVRGHVTAYANPRELAKNLSLTPQNYALSSGIVCVKTVETYFGETRSEWCFDIDNSVVWATPRESIPDDVIIAAKSFPPHFDEYVQGNQLYFRLFGVDHQIYNSGCTRPYIIPYSDTAEHEMVERLGRLGFPSVEPSK